VAGCEGWNLEHRRAQAKLGNKDIICWVHDRDNGNNRELGWGGGGEILEKKGKGGAGKRKKKNL